MGALQELANQQNSHCLANLARQHNVGAKDTFPSPVEVNGHVCDALPFLKSRSPSSDTICAPDGFTSPRQGAHAIPPQNTSDPGETKTAVHLLFKTAPTTHPPWLGAHSEPSSCTNHFFWSRHGHTATWARHFVPSSEYYQPNRSGDAVLCEFTTLEGYQNNSEGWRRHWWRTGWEEDEESEVVLLEGFAGENDCHLVGCQRVIEVSCFRFSNCMCIA